MVVMEGIIRPHAVFGWRMCRMHLLKVLQEMTNPLGDAFSY